MPVIKFSGAMKQPVKREPIVPVQKPKSLAAELASSDSETETESDLDGSSRKVSAKKEIMEQVAAAAAEQESEDEEIKVDLKQEKQRVEDSKVSEVAEEEDDGEVIY